MGVQNLVSRPAAPALPALLPVQETAYAALRDFLDVSSLVQIEGAPGQGKTTLLHHLVRDLGGVCIPAARFLASDAQAAHAAFETAVLRRVEAAFDTHDLVAIDDIDTVAIPVSMSRGYPRPHTFRALSHMLSDMAVSRGKRLVLAGNHYRRGGWVSSRGLTVKIAALEVEDYKALLKAQLGKTLADDAIEQIYEHAPSLSTHNLVNFAKLAKAEGAFDSDSLRHLLDRHILSANTRTAEVEDLSFSDLKGFEHIAEALTTHVLNPLRNHDKLRGLGLRPKRGVLLFGPPGTGKTSVGRALAHQMQGKFFLIDGTIAPEPAMAFFMRLHQIISQAKRAAPCVLFIDDADVLLSSDYAPGYSRYFLSMLDGLESNTAGKIAVIMTAMDPSKLPPALLRSGRVELWLETKAPAQQARGEIIAAHIAALPKLFHAYDAAHVNAITDGFNAADMRRLVADVKALYAADASAGVTPTNVDGYFERAAANVRRQKHLLQLAESGRFQFGAQEAV